MSTITLADILGPLVPGKPRGPRVIVLTRVAAYHGEVLEATADAITIRCGCADTHTIPAASIQSMTEVPA
jgi:hypothetical protein